MKGTRLTEHSWQGKPDAPMPGPQGARDWLRVARRGVPAVAVLAAGLALLLALRLVEAPLHGARRPWTPAITRGVCRIVLRCLGIGLAVEGRPMTGEGPVVANHTAWIDVLALNAAARAVFVSRAEVAGWPGVGLLARATGTVFLDRRRSAAAKGAALLRARLGRGERLVFFPEATTSDGRRVLPFRAPLFSAFLGVPGARVQPVAVEWRAPPGRRADFYGWWGDMDFSAHVLMILAVPRQGAVRIRYGDPIPVGEDRKALAAEAERAVRAMLPYGERR